ncbi:MAG: response regulator [Bacteroidia bacterium]|nr:response regulator [Bacteroidia bacterium]
MAKPNILVVEDESIVAKDIQNSLKKLGYSVMGTIDNGEDALKLIDGSQPDIVLMDIMLKGAMSGIEAATLIKEKYDIPVIYLTAYADENTLNKAKITEPHGYIIKPFKEVDLHTAIEVAMYKHSKELEIKKERDMLYSLVENKNDKDVVFVKSNSRMVKIRTKDIYFVEALKDYVIINTVNARYTVLSTMKNIEQKLSSKDFIRVHRSFIVLIDKIVAIDHNVLLLEDDKKEIPIGGSYKDELVKSLNML